MTTYCNNKKNKKKICIRRRLKMLSAHKTVNCVVNPGEYKETKYKDLNFAETEKYKHNILYLYPIILSKITWNNYILNTKITLPFIYHAYL